MITFKQLIEGVIEYQYGKDISESVDGVSLTDIILEEVSLETWEAIVEAIMDEVSEETMSVLSELTGKGKLGAIAKDAERRSSQHYSPDPGERAAKGRAYSSAYKATADRAKALGSGDKSGASAAKAAQGKARADLEKRKGEYHDKLEPEFHNALRKSAPGHHASFDGTDMYDTRTSKTTMRDALSGNRKIGAVFNKAKKAD